MSFRAISRQTRRAQRLLWVAVSLAALLIAFIRLGITSSAGPNPIAPQTANSAAILNIGILVFREGLECVLVLATATASMTGDQQAYQHPVAVGAGSGFIATVTTWFIVVHILDDLGQKTSVLNLQAGTGLLAIVVLLVVMNWFFHKIYWTGWISQPAQASAAWK